ncbi:MAG: butyrate kinase [Bacteroides sp.]
MSAEKILAINPGSTSTKIAVFEGEKQIFITTIRHSTEEISQYPNVAAQFEFRKNLILSELQNAKIDLSNLVAIVGRGGLLRPIPSGVYEVNENMKRDLCSPECRQHASNLGALIASSIASGIPGARAFIADPVVVDEMNEVARVSGLPTCPRISVFHALNQKAVARRFAKEKGKKYEELNLVVAHLGGGISVAAHQQGRVIDVNNALDGDGPFSPERAGSLPTGGLVELCFSSNLTKDEVKKFINGKGGMVAHVGYNNAQALEEAASKGDAKAKLIQDAMCYNIAKWIGAMSVVLSGKVDGIILTGGIAHNKYLVEYVKKMVSFIAPLTVYPGEDEMAALALNALMVLRGELSVKEY